MLLLKHSTIYMYYFLSSLAYDDLGRFQSLFFNVSLELDFRSRLYYVSLVYAVLTAGGFLLLTLFFKLIFWVTHK